MLLTNSSRAAAITVCAVTATPRASKSSFMTSSQPLPARSRAPSSASPGNLTHIGEPGIQPDLGPTGTGAGSAPSEPVIPLACHGFHHAVRKIKFSEVQRSGVSSGKSEPQHLFFGKDPALRTSWGGNTWATRTERSM